MRKVVAMTKLKRISYTNWYDLKNVENLKTYKIVNDKAKEEVSKAKYETVDNFNCKLDSKERVNILVNMLDQGLLNQIRCIMTTKEIV